MAKKTTQELLKFVQSKVGTLYVYGAKGKVVSLQQIQSLRKQYGTSFVPYSDDKKAGKICVDCSGLISWYTGIIRSSTGYKNTANEIVSISKRTNAHIGWAVWMQGHIGIYLGDDMYIAADGSKYGVRIARLNQNKFTHLLKLCDIEYNNMTLNKVDVEYCVKTLTYGWLPTVKNLEDYAGYKDNPITAIAVKVSTGKIRYQVHVLNKGWYDYVTGFNVNDIHNGYAGDGKNKIDMVRIYYETPGSIRPYKKAKYKTIYDWQYDDETSRGQDGYAGIKGKPITRLQIIIE